ncbi:hypothetical protein PDL71_01085 [Lacibacter sp. MH-610]|uniref:hypothetical protein n=1 Tax=Lacibacter sp. MH-610 TaxID=3020883 RepID=UPI0038915C8E
MQKVKNLNRIWSWILALVITSAMAVACNNEGEKTEEPAADTPAVTAPAVTDTTKKDSMPPIDTGATTRPDGKPAGSQ